MKQTRVALVTGGAKRLGREFSLFLAQNGYDLAIHYNSSADEAEDLCQEIRAMGKRAIAYRADFAKRGGYVALFQSVIADFSQVDLLINSASLMVRAPLADTNEELYDLMLNVNFLAPYFLTKEMGLQARKGQVINILDTRILKNQFQFNAYHLAKKQLADFTKMAALEFAPNLRVNGLAPGLILPTGKESSEYLEKIINKNPQKRVGLPQNLIFAINYLLDNDFVTGEILFVDGGEHLN